MEIELVGVDNCWKSLTRKECRGQLEEYQE